MELSCIILNQTLTMALYMLMGYLLFKGKKISIEGSKSLAAILLWLVLPCVIINSFCVAPTGQKAIQLGISAALAALALMLAMAVSHILYRKSPVENFAAAFSNAGFMGIPLVRACFGDDAVFFLVGFVALLNVLQWTYGASVLSRGKARMGLKQILLNPIAIGLFSGIVLFATGIGAKLPSVIQNTVKGISSLNGPLAMLVLGVYLEQTDPKAMLITPRLYLLSSVRLILIPVLTLLLLWVIPVDSTIAITILAAACACRFQCGGLCADLW